MMTNNPTRRLPSQAHLTCCAIVLLAAPLLAQDSATSVVTALEQAAEHLHLGNPHLALEALKPVESSEPDNPWMWFYRGTAHQQLRDPYEAMECYDHALDVLTSLDETDSELYTKIRQQRQRARRQVLTFSLSTGLAYDTNVSYLGDDVVGVLGVVDTVEARDDGKFASNFSVEYAPVSTAEQTLAMGLRLGHNWHFAVEQFDYQDYGATLLYARRFNRHYEATLRYDYDMTYLGNDSFLSNHAVTPGLDYIWERSASPFRLDRTKVYYQFQAQNFLVETTPDFNRDGVIHSLGASQSFLFEPTPQWLWEVNLGYLFSSVHTGGTEFDRRQHDFQLSLGVPLVNPAKPNEYLLIKDLPLVMQFGFGWQLGDYTDVSLLDSAGRRRFDFVKTYSWAISQQLVNDPDLGEMAIQGLIQVTDADSNVLFRDATTSRSTEPYSYDKVLYGLQFVWRW